MNFASIQAAAETKLKADEYVKKPEVMAPVLPSTTVVHHSETYCQSKSWNRCQGVFEAIEKRSKGQKFLSYREADISARNNLLDKQIVVDQLMNQLEFMITEDVAGADCSVYELRRRYNILLQELRTAELTQQRGLDYKRDLYHKQPEAQKKKCDEYMDKIERQLLSLHNEKADIEHHLKEIGLPLWPEEYKHGFHQNLCRPEYMTEDQYIAKIRNFQVVYADA